MTDLNLKIGKIAGNPDKLFWSQIHVFLPEDKKKKLLFGNLLVSFCLKAKQEEIDIASFGKETISRFHEIYYSSQEPGVFKKLKSSLKLLVDEFSKRLKIEIAASVIVSSSERKTIGYFASTDEGKAFILRDSQLVEILQGEKEEIKLSSGFLKDNDLLVLGTSKFFQMISLGALKAALENKEVDEAVESLAPIIHGHEENNQTAAVIFKVKLRESEKPLKPLPKTSLSPKLSLKSRLKNLKIVFTSLIKGFKKFKKEAPIGIRIKDEQKRVRAKKTTLSVALILIVLLVISVILGVRKRSTSDEVKIAQNLVSEANYRYEQAVSLIELNPLRARSLLAEAKDLIDQGIDEVESKSEKKKVEELLKKIELELEKVAKEYKFEKGEIFLDLSLVKEEFKGNSWAVVEENIYIFDKEKGTVLQVEIENKSSQVVAGGEKLALGKLIAAADKRIFILIKKKLLVIDVDKTEIIDQIEAEDWGKIVDLIGFSSNAYLLDAEKGQIWKYRGTADGLAEKSSYLKGEGYDLTEAISLAIDGSVWLLFSDGEIVKYTRGKKDPFVVSGLEKPFAEAIKLFTNEELDNLYILDRRNTRVVIINKETGEYKAQYVWSGIAGITDLAAFEKEGKILLLAGERIYQIGIKE